MSNAPSARRGRTSITSAILVSVTGLLLCSGLAVHHLGGRQWDRMSTQAEQQLAAWENQDFSRSVAWGESVAGNSFVFLDRAASRASELGGADFNNGGEDRLLVDILLGKERNPETVQATLARWAPVVAEVQAGARCNEARPLTEVRKGFSARIMNLLTLRRAVNAASATARTQALEGEGVQAVQLGLDVLSVSGDLFRSPTLIEHMIGAALCTIVTTQVFTDEVLATLDGEALDLLAAGLARIDERLPVAMALEGEVLLCAQGFANVEATLTQVLQLPQWSAWRYGFSSRWMAAEGWLAYQDYATALDQSAHLPWPQRQAAMADALERALATRNPVLDVMVPNLGGAERTLRTLATELRLLRLAVDQRNGTGTLDLPDPFGAGNLHQVVDVNGTYLRSEGTRADKRIERFVARG